MTLNASFKDSILYGDLEDTENKSVENASIAIQNGFVNFYPATKPEHSNSKEYEKILDLTELAIKKYANSQYKFASSLEPNEIEQIKKALNSYINNNEKVSEIKREILEDLTEFQKQIITNHREKVTELVKEKQSLEKQMMVLEYNKNKLIMDRLSKIIWPYDEKTKEYDQKIAQLQAKVEQYKNKIEKSKTMRPVANERDILLYKLHLKEKFGNK